MFLALYVSSVNCDPMSKMLRYIVLLSISCLYIDFSSAHENDYLDTEKNRKLLMGGMQKTFKRSDVMPFLLKRNILKSTKSMNQFSFDEDVEERVDFLKIVEEGLSAITEDDLANRLNEAADDKNNTVPEGLIRCRNDTELFITSAVLNVEWAAQMFDAYGKPGSQTLEGNVKMLGSYDECLAVKATVSPPEVQFRGMYCKATLYPWPGQTGFMAQILTLGMCLPDTCSQTDVNTIVNEYLVKQQIKFFAVVACDERDYPFDTRAIVAIVICAIFGFLVVMGTAYDVIFHHIIKHQKPSKLAATIKYGTLSNVKTHNLGQSSNTEKTPLISEVSTSGVVESDTSCEISLKEPSERKPGLWSEILMSFSVYTNGAKLLNTKQPAGSLTAVHGIRFLSMSWVILGHCYFSLIPAAAVSGPYLQAAVKRWTFHAIINATVAVDTFFALSGLLVTYLTLKELKRLNGKLNWFLFYFHRYWRLTPVYMLSLMIFVCLFHYFGDGPSWSQKGFSIDYCSDTWWTNLLYVNNLVKRDEMCFGWSWYLANDMQFYVLSPLILLPLYYFPIIGYIVLSVFLLATLVTAGVISRDNNIAPGPMYQVEGKAGNFNDYYMTPYCRMGPYIIGMIAGYLLYRCNAKAKMSKTVVICGWLLATASALAVLYGPYESANGTPMTNDVAAFYNAINRTVWGAAVCWVVYACATGYGGYVNTLLSWEGLVPLSRLSYAAYLIHLPVEMMFTNTLRQPPHLNDINITFNYLGMLLMSYGVALIVSLTFETPMMGLERAILKRERRN